MKESLDKFTVIVEELLLREPDIFKSEHNRDITCIR